MDGALHPIFAHLSSAEYVMEWQSIRQVCHNWNNFGRRYFSPKALKPWQAFYNRDVIKAYEPEWSAEALIGAARCTLVTPAWVGQAAIRYLMSRRPYCIKEVGSVIGACCKNKRYPEIAVILDCLSAEDIGPAITWASEIHWDQLITVYNAREYWGQIIDIIMGINQPRIVRGDYVYFTDSIMRFGGEAIMFIAMRIFNHNSAKIVAELMKYVGPDTILATIIIITGTRMCDWPANVRAAANDIIEAQDRKHSDAIIVEFIESKIAAGAKSLQGKVE